MAQVINAQQREKDQPPVWDTLDPWAQRFIAGTVNAATVGSATYPLGYVPVIGPPLAFGTGAILSVTAASTNVDSRVAESIVNTGGEIVREVVATRNDIVRISDGGGNAAGGLAGCTVRLFSGRRC